MSKTDIRYRFERVPDAISHHAVHDRRPAQTYRVLVIIECEHIYAGKVYSKSEASWRTTSTGVRCGFRGYGREWVAQFPDGSTRRCFRTRQDAAEALIKEI